MPEVKPSPLNPFKKTTAGVKKALVASVIALILAIVSAIFAWFSWMEIHNTVKTIDTYTANIQQRAKAVTSGLELQIKALQVRVDDTQKKLDRLSSLSLQSHDQRAFSEAAYLIHLANLQLVIGRNADNALHILEIAQNQLKQISSPSVLELKQAVAKDIVVLQKAPRIDVAKLLARLQTLKEDVAKLPSLPTQKMTKPQDASSNDTDNKASLPWYKKLGYGLSGFKDLITIRHDKEPIKPLLSPEQLLFLKENVQLKISEVEWAILHQNASVYQQGLNSAKALLLEHYPNHAAMASTLQDMDSLLEVNITPKLPNLSQTLTVLHSSVLQHKSSNNKPASPKNKSGGSE